MQEVAQQVQGVVPQEQEVVVQQGQVVPVSVQELLGQAPCFQVVQE